MVGPSSVSSAAAGEPLVSIQTGPSDSRKFGAQHVPLCSLTCSDLQLFGLDFISHAERKNAEEWW